MRHFLPSFIVAFLLLVGLSLPNAVQAGIDDAQSCSIHRAGKIDGPSSGCTGQAVTFSNKQHPAGNTSQFEYVWLVNSSPSTSGAQVIRVNYKSARLIFNRTGSYYVRRCARPKNCNYNNWPAAGESNWEHIQINNCNNCAGVNITRFKLNDLNGNNDVNLSNGGTYQLSSLPSRFNIEANVSGSHIQKVKFEISGDYTCTNTEYYYPWNAPGGSRPWNIGAGTYTIKAKVYVCGQLCKTKTITITVVDNPCEGIAINKIKLNDLNGGSDFDLQNGGTYSMSQLPSKFNIEAMIANRHKVKKVKFEISGDYTGNNTEYYYPYNAPGGSAKWNIGPGTYTIKAKVYAKDHSLCKTKTVTFTIKDPCDGVDITGWKFTEKGGSQVINLTDGGVYSVGSLPDSFELEACVTGNDIAKVKFTIRDPQTNAVIDGQTERFAPYNYPGSNSKWNLPPGTYKIQTDVWVKGNSKLCVCKYITITIEEPLASIGDFVFNDKNLNSLNDTGEDGVPNIIVELLDCNGTILDSTKTDLDGFYVFDSLPAGQYKVRFSNVPNGFEFSKKDQGTDDTIDTDVDQLTGETDCITLGPGEHNNTIDAGICLFVVKRGAFGDYVWDDLNCNGIQDPNEPGVAGVKVRVWLCDDRKAVPTPFFLEDSAVTDKDGFYIVPFLRSSKTYMLEFLDLPSGYVFTTMMAGNDSTKDSDVDPATGFTGACMSTGFQTAVLSVDAGIKKRTAIGDFVFNDKNLNSLNDPGEDGVPNVIVELLDCAGNILDSTTTDFQGYYSFEDLSAGTYKLRFSNIPNGFEFSKKDQGTDDTIDTDVDQITGETDCITIADGEINNTIDAGICLFVVKRGAFGDRVWADANGNGLQDPGEAGVPGVKVVVWLCDDRQATPTPFFAEDSAVTDANGYYIVPFLRSSKTYMLQFKDLPAGYTFTTPMVGSDSTIDSDVDPATGYTGACMSTGFQTAILTVDAGLVPSSGNVRMAGIIENLDITVYPNPFVETLMIDLEGENADQPVAVRIFNLNGVEVYSNSSILGSARLNLPSSTWVPGMYILEISQGAQVEQVKLIKQ